MNPTIIGAGSVGEALAAIVSLRMRHGWSGRNGWKLIGPMG